MTLGKYAAKIKCTNCGHDNYAQVSQGTTVQAHLIYIGLVCEMCKCAINAKKERK